MLYFVPFLVSWTLEPKVDIKNNLEHTVGTVHAKLSNSTFMVHDIFEFSFL